MQDPKVESANRVADDVAGYEAPQVESVVTSDEVEREAHYGGGISMNP